MNRYRLLMTTTLAEARQAKLLLGRYARVADMPETLADKAAKPPSTLRGLPQPRNPHGLHAREQRSQESGVNTYTQKPFTANPAKPSSVDQWVI
jgi:hypothetical protein